MYGRYADASRAAAKREMVKRLSLSPAQERKYKKLKSEIIGEVELLRLNQARIDTLVEKLSDQISKRLISYEGRRMRLAESHGVVREDLKAAARQSAPVTF